MSPHEETGGVSELDDAIRNTERERVIDRDIERKSQREKTSPWGPAVEAPAPHLTKNVQWFRGVLVFEAHRLLYHSGSG